MHQGLPCSGLISSKLVSGVVTGWQTGSHAEMGWVGAELGRPRRKRLTTFFIQFKSFFQLSKSTGENKIRKNTCGLRKNVKFCIQIDLNICHNFCIGHFDQWSTIFK
jgi:hypothetical protein